MRHGNAQPRELPDPPLYGIAFARAGHYMHPMQLLRLFLPPWARVAVVAAFVSTAIGFACLPEPVRAQANFDGTWSVLIVTQTGECDRAYRYGIRIQNGQILYGGEAGVSFTGRVDAKGQVTATVSRGEQKANGTGRLSGNRGAGTWRGVAATGACAGRWEAERR
jgi:hypothetical protein